MQTLRTIAALLGLWSGAMLIVCWTVIQYFTEDPFIELKEEWIIGERKTEGGNDGGTSAI